MTFEHRCDAEGCGKAILPDEPGVELSMMRFVGPPGPHRRDIAHETKHFHIDCSPVPAPPEPETPPA